MEIKKCCVCDMVLYPDERRYQVKIWIYPEGEEGLFDWELPCDEEAESLFEDANVCDSLSFETHCDQDTLGKGLVHEINLTLCKDCQTRFLQHFSVEENLLFFNKEFVTKIIH